MGLECDNRMDALVRRGVACYFLMEVDFRIAFLLFDDRNRGVIAT